tara:strand:+ start:2962 stop:3366 length:405 start_codon:yes stop_codon:yes gene_type:complete
MNDNRKIEPCGRMLTMNALKEYRLNEDANAHGENLLLLAKVFGTEEQINLCERAIAQRDRMGFAGLLSQDAYAAVGHYYKQLEKGFHVLPDTPKTIKRYDPQYCSSEIFQGMSACDDGEYVLWDDIKDLVRVKS